MQGRRSPRYTATTGRRLSASGADTPRLVFRTLRGWEYRFIARPDQLPPLHIPMGSCPGGTDRAETIFTAERHIAANGWEPTDELDVFPVWFGTDTNREHAAMRREMIEQRKWYKQMHHLMKNAALLTKPRAV